jgi:hypothetical protein
MEKIRIVELRGKEMRKLGGMIKAALANGQQYLIIPGRNAVKVQTWEVERVVDTDRQDHQKKRKVLGYVGRSNENGNIYLPPERYKRPDWFAAIRTPSWNPKRGHGTKG